MTTNELLLIAGVGVKAAIFAAASWSPLAWTQRIADREYPGTIP